MRTCVVAGSQGTNIGAERKRFDGTAMLPSCTDRLFPKMGVCQEVLGGGPAPPSKL